ncbi:MAG: class I SAM-dependent methyltransferase [Bdellovibrionaceae bacterium]|nr:class I SAM-dependent methyltransferase [Pseudobdellovibrionaceae bacterium]
MEVLDDPSLPLLRRLEVIMALDKVNKQYGVYQSFIKGFERFFNKKYISSEKVSLFEVGSGLGGLSREIEFWGRKRGVSFDLNLYDTQEDVLQVAEELLASQGVNVAKHIASGNYLQDYADNSFDYVISLHVIHHIRPVNEAAKALKEMMRIAKKGVYVVDFHKKWGSVTLFKVWNSLFGINQDLSEDGIKSMQRAYSPEELERLIHNEDPSLANQLHFKSHFLKPYWEFEFVKKE